MPQLRGLHIFGQMNRGGAELRTMDVLRCTDRTNIQMDFCALSGKAGTLDEEICQLGGTVHYLPLGRQFPARFRELLKAQGYDFVHSHVHEASGYILRLAAQVGVGCRIAHFRSTSDGKSPSWRRAVQRMVLRRWIHVYATHILGVSRTTLAAAWSAKWATDPRCQVVYNGIAPFEFSLNQERTEVRRELSLGKEAFTVIHVGNVRPPKNHAKILSVFREFQSRHPDAHLLLVGECNSSYGQEIQERARAIGLGDTVSFLGTRTDVSRLLAAADVLLFPSHYEGLPGAVLEACAAGLPVVASDLTVHREIGTYLSGLQLLDLAAGDERWCEAIEAVESRMKSVGHRAALQQEFLASPFQIQATTTAFAEIWNSAVHGEVTHRRRKVA